MCNIRMRESLALVGSLGLDGRLAQAGGAAYSCRYAPAPASPRVCGKETFRHTDRPKNEQMLFRPGEERRADPADLNATRLGNARAPHPGRRAKGVPCRPNDVRTRDLGLDLLPVRRGLRPPRPHPLRKLSPVPPIQPPLARLYPPQSLPLPLFRLQLLPTP